jgi:hypothetical protein
MHEEFETESNVEQTAGPAAYAPRRTGTHIGVACKLVEDDRVALARRRGQALNINFPPFVQGGPTLVDLAPSRAEYRGGDTTINTKTHRRTQRVATLSRS